MSPDFQPDGKFWSKSAGLGFHQSPALIAVPPPSTQPAIDDASLQAMPSESTQIWLQRPGTSNRVRLVLVSHVGHGTAPATRRWWTFLEKENLLATLSKLRSDWNTASTGTSDDIIVSVGPCGLRGSTCSRCGSGDGCCSRLSSSCRLGTFRDPSSVGGVPHACRRLDCDTVKSVLIQVGIGISRRSRS
jgi:hypothetical protein